MGARPIALLNSPAVRRARRAGTARLLEASVAGIAGTATASASRRSAARSCSSRPYAATRSVNVFCLGIATASDIIKGVARGRQLRSTTSARRPAATASRRHDGVRGVRREVGGEALGVQVGDPFMEKLLLEACLEVMQTDALVGIQDMARPA
jgi:phosphoribosylformylglycinamidine synthase